MVPFLCHHNAECVSPLPRLHPRRRHMGKRTFEGKSELCQDDRDSQLQRNLKAGPRLNHMQNQQTEDVPVPAGVASRRSNNFSNRTSDDFVVGVGGLEGSPKDNERPKRVSRITEGEPAAVIFSGAEVSESSPNRASRAGVRTAQPEPAPFARYPIRPMDEGYTSCTADFL